MPTTLQRLAEWAAALRFEDIPPRVVAKAKLQFLSVLAAVYAGHPTRAVRAIREVALSTRSHGRATVFPQHDATSPTVAVVANAAASMALDFDDYLFLGHTGHSAVLAALAMAEELGLSGRELLTAQVAANEIGGRMGAAVFVGPQNGQLWTHLHALGAACAGARLLELSAEQHAHALALALYQPPFATWPGFMGPDSKLLSAAMPARDGLFASRLAGWGITGPLDVLDRPDGFAPHFAFRFLPQMFSGLGQSWVSDTLSFKLHPGCAYLSAALDALADLRAQFAERHRRSLQPADVEELRVFCTLLSIGMERLATRSPPERLTAVRVNFSIPWSLALAIRDGALTPHALHDEAELSRSEQELRPLSERIRVLHDWELTAALLESLLEQLPLGALFSARDLAGLLSRARGLGRDLGGLPALRPGEVQRLIRLLLRRGARIAGGAGRWLAKELGQAFGAEAPHPFDLKDADLARLRLPLAARLELRLRGGLRLTAQVDVPAGAAGRDEAETAGQVRRKFREQAEPFLKAHGVERALDLVDRLEQLPQLGELTAALCVP
ncbi:MAG: MmgE/PrpD family protein [Myxococcales bacterium]|nr:MmgE/PrpD family protein [Myxococcales bacterium]